MHFRISTRTRKKAFLQGIVLACLFSLLLPGCQDDQPEPPSSELILSVHTDKARYAPNERVTFSIDRELPANVRIRYKHLDNIIGDIPYQGLSWQWLPPNEDFKGYMAEIVHIENDQEVILACIAVDVSTDWSRFPRYGFLSDFSAHDNARDVIENLNRHHINGVLFYDWQYKYHKPIAGTTASPSNSWQNIANREVRHHSMLNYISMARNRNMSTMYRNLAYGATDTAYEEHVSERWHLFKDDNQQEVAVHQLPKPPFTSDILLMNPASLGWQQYIASRNKEVFSVYDFDGWHMDQLGDKGFLYDINGNLVPLASDFKPFIDFIKDDNPSKRLIFNARNQFGQYAIAHSPVDLLFTEVLPPNNTYSDLGRIIINNNSFGSRTKSSVLAAVMSTTKAAMPGYFNTPSVLFTSAIVFALGSSLLQMGEHLLSDEYYPNARLKMHQELQHALLKYYDFLVAYQNILRDGGIFNRPSIVVANRSCCVNHWPPQPGNIVLIGKETGNTQVVHLINFMDTESLDWQDPSGKRPEPVRQNNLTIVHNTNRLVKKVWFASPDLNFGSSTALSFTQKDTEVVFTIPSLKYWSMFVINY